MGGGRTVEWVRHLYLKTVMLMEEEERKECTTRHASRASHLAFNTEREAGA